MRPKYVCNSESFRVCSHTAHQAGRHLAHHAHPKPTGPVLCKKRGADRTPALGAHLPVTVPQLPAGSVSSGSQRPREVKIRKLDLIAYSLRPRIYTPKTNSKIQHHDSRVNSGTLARGSVLLDLIFDLYKGARPNRASPDAPCREAPPVEWAGVLYPPPQLGFYTPVYNIYTKCPIAIL